MRFSSESDLQAELANYELGVSGAYHAVSVRREVPVGNCKPDFVYIGFGSTPTDLPWPRSWSYRHSYVSWLLRMHIRLDPNSIAELAFESRERFEPVIQDLLLSGAIVEAGPGLLSLADEIATLRSEVIAVEVKLRKWKRALEQAIDYKRFANMVIVAMDRAGIPTSDAAISEFKRRGIGLCAVGREIEWLIRPELAVEALGPEHEYLVRSATALDRQTLWSWRYSKNESSHA